MAWPNGLLGWSLYDRRKSDRSLELPATSANGSRAAHVPEQDIAQGAAAEALVPPPDGGYLAPDLLKGLEVSFGIEASQLEREAVESARAWAEKGLPRHDLEPSGTLEVEEVLARRTSRVF